MAIRAKGPHAWVLDETAGRPFIKKALEMGINFFDTANMYQMGPAKKSWAGRFEILPKEKRLSSRQKSIFRCEKIRTVRDCHANPS